MANSKITALPVAASVLSTDIIPCVIDPAGVPDTKRVSFAVIRTLLTGGLGTASQMLAMKYDATGPEWRSYITDAATALVTPSSGLIRISDGTSIPVIQGISAGVTWNGLTYDATSANWTWGNTSQYSTINGYSVIMTGATGCIAIDSRNAIQTDLCMFSACLAANKTTTAVAGDATNLTFLIGANESWEIEVDCNLSCSGVGGAKLGLDLPAAAVLEGQVDGAGVNAGSYTSEAMTTRNVAYGTFGTAGDSAKRVAHMRAVVRNGANAGSVTLRIFSTTVAQTSTIYANAKMRAQRVTAL